MKRATVPVQITLDPEADAAYIYLADEPAIGWRQGKTVAVPVDEISGMVNVDLDADGRLIGVEVLAASSVLPDKMLASFDHEG